MTLDPRTAPLDAIRDWFAKRDGWQFQYNSWWHPHHLDSTHPYPPTRDGAAAAMPSGWQWTKGHLIWRAMLRDWATNVSVNDTGNEIDDRYRLAAAARQAMDATDAARRAASGEHKG